MCFRAGGEEWSRGGEKGCRTAGTVKRDGVSKGGREGEGEWVMSHMQSSFVIMDQEMICLPGLLSGL